VRFEVERLDHVALSVRDQAASTAWYQDVLGLERVYEEAWGEMPVMLVAHGTGVALFPPRDGADGVSAIRVLHLAFRVDRANFEAARASLAERGVTFEFQDHVVAHSLYFRDPDGHQLELTTYEL
jgi:catechol 2,3-dioxygenase-like lactoylglutathione lyase family enzyme